MACGSCVHTLALKLIAHHRNLDFIRAFELAEKAVERVEQRDRDPETRSLTEQEKAELPFDPDYTQACIIGGSQTSCIPDDPCDSVDTCSCSCPSPSKANSHYVSDTCAAQGLCRYAGGVCTKRGCNCAASTSTPYCYYACDTGYVWNPVTLLCEAVAVAAVDAFDELVRVK